MVQYDSPTTTLIGVKDTLRDAVAKAGGMALNRAKEALMNNIMKFIMPAAVAAASVVACAADSSKGFSIKTFYKPDHSPVGVGLASVTVSEADIAAAAVKIPCAVYFSEQANDSIGFVFGVSVVSLNGNAGSVSLAVHDPASAYYDSDWSGTTAAGVDFSTKFYMPFAGVKSNNKKLGDFFRYIGKYDSRVEPSQPSAGATNSYLGFWWHRGGDAYTWLGERSDSGPVVVFDVILGKDTPPGTYNVKFAQYNTDLSGEYDIPSPRVEADGATYTAKTGSLTLSGLTITVAGTPAIPLPTLYGDANCDGKVDLADAILVRQAVGNGAKYGRDGTDPSHITAQGAANADVDECGNGMTMSDADQIESYALGIVTNLPSAAMHSGSGAAQGASGADPSLRGDATCDGMVTVADGIAIMQALVWPDKYGFNVYSDGAVRRANADTDGEPGVNIRDAYRIYLLDAGQITEL